MPVSGPVYRGGMNSSPAVFPEGLQGKQRAVAFRKAAGRVCPAPER